MEENDIKENLLSNADEKSARDEVPLNRVPTISKEGNEPSPQDEEVLQEVTVEAKIKKMSVILDQPMPEGEKDKKIIMFIVKARTDKKYEWKVYHTPKEIKKSFKGLKKELNQKGFIFKSSLQAKFDYIKDYKPKEVKKEINSICGYYNEFFKNETIRNTITLREFFRISKASFSRYNSGLKPFEGYALKYADRNCCRKAFACLCCCIEGMIFNRWNKRWVILKNDMIYYTDSSTINEGKKRILFRRPN